MAVDKVNAVIIKGLLFCNNQGLTFLATPFYGKPF